MSDQHDEEEYGLVLPFLNANTSFALGFEAGCQYARMKYGGEKQFEQTIHCENQRQLMMAAKVLGWSLRFEPLSDAFAEMCASGPA